MRLQNTVGADGTAPGQSGTAGGTATGQSGTADGSATGQSGIADGTPADTAGAAGAWRCDASLETPVGYADQPVRITLLQDGVGETTVFEGTTAFPYRLQVDGAAGVTGGTAYVYLLDPVTGEATSKIEYPGIAFYQVN